LAADGHRDAFPGGCGLRCGGHVYLEQWLAPAEFGRKATALEGWLGANGVRRRFAGSRSLVASNPHPGSQRQRDHCASKDQAPLSMSHADLPSMKPHVPRRPAEKTPPKRETTPP